MNSDVSRRRIQVRVDKAGPNDDRVRVLVTRVWGIGLYCTLGYTVLIGQNSVLGEAITARNLRVVRCAKGNAWSS